MKRPFRTIATMALCCLLLAGCTENYSNGEKVGNLIEFTYKGIFWKSWEDQKELIELMKQAQVEGWKLKIRYHEVYGWNWFRNRGETSYFVDSVTVLDKNFARPLQTGPKTSGATVHDTVWVVIDKAEVARELRQRAR